MGRTGTFEELVAEGASVPVEGWDFSWFEGRAREARPPWGYAATVAERIGAASAVLDVQTGGGEVYAWALEHAPRRPGMLAATESWPPNVALAAERLEPLGAEVVRADEGTVPFEPGTFDLVVSRHPVVTPWPAVAHVLRPGGTYLSQQVGPGSNRELTEALMGRQPVNRARSPEAAASAAEQAGLVVVDLRQATLRVEFGDVGAVVHFLRKVPWTVPGFTVDAYRDRLAELHDRIERDGRFVCHAQRFLIEARRPRGGTT